MKKVLILGGSNEQIPIITKAIEMGHHVIVCDYNDHCLGRKHAHEFYTMSIADEKGVLNVAKQLKIDGIVSYASDLAANTAAYVAEKLDLPTSPYKSVEILTNKELFRKFLKENNFNTPRAHAYDCLEDAVSDFHQFKLPIMIKPIDSSGSRGVSKVDTIDSLEEKVNHALLFSQSKRFIVEEFIESNTYEHVGGEGFSVNGKLLFRNYHYEYFSTNSLNPFVPLITIYPSFLPEHIQQSIDHEIQRLFDLLKMKTGAYNFEIRIDHEDKIYLMEIAPRNGGGNNQSLVNHSTNFKLNENIINASLGHEYLPYYKEPTEYWAMYVIHSNKDGIYKCLDINKELEENNIVEYELDVKPGDQIYALNGAHHSLGTMLLKFSTEKELLEKIDHLSKLVQVIVEEE